MQQKMDILRYALFRNTEHIRMSSICVLLEWLYSIGQALNVDAAIVMQYKTGYSILIG